jgi:hypothetical protein
VFTLHLLVSLPAHFSCITQLAIVIAQDHFCDYPKRLLDDSELYVRKKALTAHFSAARQFAKASSSNDDLFIGSSGPIGDNPWLFRIDDIIKRINECHLVNSDDINNDEQHGVMYPLLLLLLQCLKMMPHSIYPFRSVHHHLFMIVS